MAFIETHQSLRDHRKILAMAAELDMPEAHVAGHCIYLWLWSLDNAPEGMLPASERIIERAAGWQGQSGALLTAMVNAGMVDRADDGRLCIHDWWDYAGRLIDKRKSDAERKRVARNSNGHPADVQRTSDGHPTDGAGTLHYTTVPPSLSEVEDDHKGEGDQNNSAAVAALSLAPADAGREVAHDPSPAVSTPIPIKTTARAPLPLDSDAVQLAARLRDAILSHKPDAREAALAKRMVKLQNWALPIDCMIRLDKRTVPKIAAVIDWLPTSTFWRRNVLSPSKLREQFDRLELQMQEEARSNHDRANGARERRAGGGTRPAPTVAATQARGPAVASVTW